MTEKLKDGLGELAVLVLFVLMCILGLYASKARPAPPPERCHGQCGPPTKDIRCYMLCTKRDYCPADERDAK